MGMRRVWQAVARELRAVKPCIEGAPDLSFGSEWSISVRAVAEGFTEVHGFDRARFLKECGHGGE